MAGLAKARAEKEEESKKINSKISKDVADSVPSASERKTAGSDSLRAILRQRLEDHKAGVGEKESFEKEKLRTIASSKNKNVRDEKGTNQDPGSQDSQDSREPAPRFTLAGPENDAAVQQMLGGRESSASVNESGLLTADSPSLFERVKEAHRVCVQHHCVGLNP